MNTLFFFRLIFNYVCRYIFLHLLIRGGARGSGSSETGILVDYELPDGGAGNRTWVHWKSSKSF